MVRKLKVRRSGLLRVSATLQKEKKKADADADADALALILINTVPDVIPVHLMAWNVSIPDNTGVSFRSVTNKF
jgi:hypothetical protein